MQVKKCYVETSHTVEGTIMSVTQEIMQLHFYKQQ